jgi:methionyl-tRNA formyltransferase
MRVVFMGTPDFAVPALQALLASSSVDVTLVVSQPDRPAGRGGQLRSPPVVQAARRAGVPVWQPESLKGEGTVERLSAEQADFFVVAAYGEILRQKVLDIPRIAPLNLHASLLPRWRGAAPIQWAIASGDAATGVALMRMEKGLDTGAVYAMDATMIDDTETAGELHERLAAMGAILLMRELPRIAASECHPRKQPATRSCYASMLTREHRHLPEGYSAQQAASWVNGMSPWPGVAVQVAGERLALQRARATERPAQGASGTFSVTEGRLWLNAWDGLQTELLEVQRPGRRMVSGSEFVRGAHVDNASVERLIE